MYIQESNLTYANENSDLYNVMLCSIDNVRSSSNDEEGTPILSTTAYRDTWDYHGTEKTAPLQFNLTIAKRDGKYFDAYELRAIKKWLCKDSFNWLQVSQSDTPNVYYYCKISNPRSVSVGSLNAGLEFSITCNSQYAWSELNGKNKVYSSSTTKTYSLNINLDFDNYKLKPTLIINPKVNGNISIKSTTTNETITFTNCVVNETITLECSTYKIKSSNGRVMIDKWNRNILELLDGTNVLLLTGNFTMQIQYRLPIRIGG